MVPSSWPCFRSWISGGNVVVRGRQSSPSWQSAQHASQKHTPHHCQLQAKLVKTVKVQWRGSDSFLWIRPSVATLVRVWCTGKTVHLRSLSTGSPAGHLCVSGFPAQRGLNVESGQCKRIDFCEHCFMWSGSLKRWPWEARRFSTKTIFHICPDYSNLIW